MRMLAGVAATTICLGAAWWSRLPVAADDPQAGEEEIHRAPGAATAGKPAVRDPTNRGMLRLTILDAATRQPTFARLNVVGADGNYYEPDENPLAPWSLHRLGNRLGKGPFRYYGWFFYGGGTLDLHVPPGAVRVEAWKGFEHLPVTLRTTVAAGCTAELSVELQRVSFMGMNGMTMHSGDTHIHLDRRNATDDARCLDLAEAEDIEFEHILCMNDPRSYQPTMDQQLHPQLRGMGKSSEVARGRYQIASGQEYRANTYGHICLVGGSRLVEAELSRNPNNWPPFGVVAAELHGIGGYAFHAHGGYGKEIYADLAQRATDGVELLQFAEYRDVGLEGWYHILNAGLRFPAVGASDYPYCRALGDCRTYVLTRGANPTFQEWDRAAAEGRSFFTTGPLLWLFSGEHFPGDTLALPPEGSELPFRIRMQSPVVPVEELQLIEGGVVRERLKLAPETDVRHQHQRDFMVWEVRLPLKRSTWVAARALARSPGGREDVEAHTNPVYIKVGDTSPVRRESVEWLLKKLDERIAVNAARSFEERALM
ncbi:MAG: CehA/McbA family metallohydrolase, partial [Deltaproteobacteria bacterium]